MDYAPFVVSWNEFARKWKEHRDPEFFYEAMENGAPWLVEYPHRDWFCQRAEVYASDIYDAVRGHLDPATRATLDPFCRAFFWSNNPDGVYVQDLRAGEPREVFAITMKPATVNRYLKRISSVSLEGVREVCGQHCPPLDNPWMKDSQDFVEFIRLWVRLLYRASEKGWGVVVLIA